MSNKNTTPEDRWYKYKQAAEYLGLSERQVRRATASGALGFTRLGGLYVYFSQAQLDQYIADCTVEPTR